MTDKILLGQVALVTGSGRGLGKAYALELARAGADVIITDRSSASAARFGEAASGEEVADEVRSLGVRSGFFAADLRDPAQIEAMIAAIVKDFGRIDLLVNNAGGDIGAQTPRPDPNDCLDIKIEDIESVVGRNLLSTMYMCKFVGQHMRQRKSGKIINIGSIGGHMAVATGVVYGAAKLAVEHYTRCLAEQMRPYNVNVNCLAPGYAKSARISATREINEDESLSRLQRFAEPEDMARIILFLAGPDSDRLTGETIVCW